MAVWGTKLTPDRTSIDFGGSVAFKESQVFPASTEIPFKVVQKDFEGT